MRHPALKVKEAILHADQDVREAAVHYFADSHSSDPSIMPLVIQAIDKHGFDNAFSAYGFLTEVVQTDDTVGWLIRQLKALGQPADEKEADPILAYISALVHADLYLVKNHEAEIMALDALDYDSRDAIAERIWFPSRTGKELWEDLEEFCQTYDNEESIPDEEIDFACRLVEALGSHRDPYADKVLAILRGETEEIGTWQECLAIRLAGEMKLEAAIPVMMNTLHEIPNDWINEECHRAFGKIGSEAVIAQFANDYATSVWHLRMFIACALEDIHSDLSVQTCLDFLKTEKDQEIRGMLLQSVLFNFSTDGIEPARQFIRQTPLDPEVLEVRSALLTACKLMGEMFPEFDAWLEDSKNDQEFRRRWHQEHPLPDENENLGDEEEDFEEFEEEEYEPPPMTIVRRSERIGRNDPCPCGSGKKFKMCCYGKSQAGKETDPYHASAMSGVVRNKSKSKFPVGTVALYGPDDKTTTKIAAGVILHDGAEAIIRRWVATDVTTNPKVQQQIRNFFERHGVKQVAMSEGNMGCPHEEGEDFPHGEDCPFCPFWKGKQGSNRKD